MNNRQYWYWFANIKGIGNKKMKYLLDYFESPEEIYKAKRTMLEKVKKISAKNIEDILSSKDEHYIKTRLEFLEKKQIKMTIIDEKDYPKKLKNIYDPPYVLYYRGKLPDENKKAISIVGARNCSEYGKKIAQKFAYELASNGYEVISGMAKGIDTYAHKGAINARKDTYAILGCGVDICYPKENIEVCMNILNSGGLISEFDMGTLPRPTNFPMRNRIISGLSDSILVIEAKEKSGSLITVDVGLEQGKEIYVIPGNIDSKLSSGCNNLIKSGAHMVTSITDILEDESSFLNSNKIDLYDTKTEKKHRKTNINQVKDKLTKDEEKVYNCISNRAIHTEEIMFKSELEFGDIMQILFELESKKLIIETSNNYYIRK